MNAKIEIQRANQFADILRSYEIYIDGKLRGEVRKGKWLQIPVSAGKHKIEAKIDWCSSNVLYVDVADAENAVVVVSNRLPVVFVLFVIIFMRKRYLKLKLKI